MINRVGLMVDNIMKTPIISNVDTPKDLYDIMLFDVNRIHKQGFFVLNSCYYRTMIILDEMKKHWLDWSLLVDVYIPATEYYEAEPTVHFAVKDQKNVIQFIENSNWWAYYITEKYNFADSKKNPIAKIQIPISEISDSDNIINILSKFFSKKMFQKESPEEIINKKSQNLYTAAKTIDTDKLLWNRSKIMIGNLEIPIPSQILGVNWVYDREKLEEYMDFLKREYNKSDDDLVSQNAHSLLTYRKWTYKNIYETEYKPKIAWR